MGRIRTIKPEFPQSESIGRLSRDARLLFIQLWTLVDDEGRTRAASRMLASLLYPYDTDAVGLIDGWLEELERADHIRRYSVEGHSYLEVINFLSHQKIDRPSKSKLPPFDEPSTNNRRAFGDPSVQEGKGRDQGKDQGMEGKGANGEGHFPPTVNLSLTDDSWMVARAVSESTGITNQWALNELRSQAALLLKESPDDMDGIRDAMTSAWQDYCSCAKSGKLRNTPMGAQKFFGEGLWKKSSMWGLRKGAAVDGVLNGTIV